MASQTPDVADMPILKPGDEHYDATCLNNHALLGPRDLDASHVPNALLQNYHRFGEVSAKRFLEKWWHEKDPKNPNDRSDWLWPNYYDAGFLLNNGQAGHPIKGSVTLTPGTLIDRFGDETSKYFCPFGTPFMMRSLGPDMLKNPTTDPNVPEMKRYRYRVYRVEQTLTLEAGPIAPGFEQMGMGTQYIHKSMDAVALEGHKIIVKLSQEEIDKLYS